MMRAKVWLAGVATALALSSTAAVASVVVVKSLGPSSKAYPPGKTFSESAKITLQGGDVVTILGPSSAQTLRGPGNFAASQVALASAAARRGRFGALRAGEVAKNPSIWDLDATQSGTMCVSNPAKLQLWRPDVESAAKVMVRSADGKVQELNWAAGNELAEWPAAVPVRSGEYQLEWSDSGEKSSMTFVTLKSPPADLVGAAQLLIENGCQNQLDLLVSNAGKSGK